jgi:uncharacterized protein (TIGR01319 family)
MYSMKIDLLVAEIGSTTTVLTAFQTIGSDLSILVQSEYKTTIPEGDVTIGIEKALDIISKKLGEKIQWNKFLATSSAAGGLTVTVHGLVYDMTVKAAQEASLGAGAIIKYVTAGRLRDSQLTRIKNINPKLIILSGGVDYGEEDIVIENAKLLASLPLKSPVVYAGNCAIQDDIKEIFDEQNKKIIITENVYPKVDQLNVEPARKIIQEVFSKHIINAPGMGKVYEIVDEEIIPTPAAVVHTTELLSTLYDDVLTIDIGGATTDIVSVTDGSPEIQKILVSPEPKFINFLIGRLFHTPCPRRMSKYLKSVSTNVYGVLGNFFKSFRYLHMSTKFNHTITPLYMNSTSFLNRLNASSL